MAWGRSSQDAAVLAEPARRHRDARARGELPVLRVTGVGVGLPGDGRRAQAFSAGDFILLLSDRGISGLLSGTTLTPHAFQGTPNHP